MAVPSKGRRVGLIRKEQAIGAKQIRDILITARDRMELTIIRAAQKKNFLTSATVRDTLYKDLQKQYVQFGGTTDAWAASRVKKVARQWRQLAIADLPAGAYDQTFSQFSRKYLDSMILAVNPQSAAGLTATNSAIGGMLQSDIRFIQKQVVETFRLGAATGLTARETRKELLARVTDERPAWQFIDKAGKNWDTKNYFRMLDRTIVANAARDSYANVVTEAGFDIVQVEGGITPGSLRFPNDPCPRWAGKILSLTGATPGFPTDEEARADGLFHPNCIHYYGVVLPREIREAKAKEKKEDKEGKIKVDAANQIREEEKTERAKERKEGVTPKGAGGRRLTSKQRAERTAERNASRARRIGREQGVEVPV